MAEYVLPKPLPLVWMGSMDDLPERLEWEPGWAFFGAPGRYGCSSLSDRYMLDVAETRPPIVVMCPSFVHSGKLHGTPFCIDSYPTDKPGDSWDTTVNLDTLVVGGKPSITVHPSIHLVGIWHGWLNDGVLTG